MLVQVPEILELLEMVEMVEMVVPVMVDLGTREIKDSVEWVVLEAVAVVAVPEEPTRVLVGAQVKLDMMVATPIDQVVTVGGIFLVVLAGLVELPKVNLDMMDIMDTMDLLETPETPVVLVLEIVDLLIPEILETLGLLEILGILEILEILELMGMQEISVNLVLL